jgi:hypothetical protein
MKAGFIILLGCWVNLAVWTFFSFAGAPGSYRGVHGSGNGYGNNESGNSFRQGTTVRSSLDPLPYSFPYPNLALVISAFDLYTELYMLSMTFMYISDQSGFDSFIDY